MRQPGGQPKRKALSRLRPALLLGLREPSRIALGLTLHVRQRIHDGEETAAQALGTDGVVFDGFNLLRSGRWRRVQTDRGGTTEFADWRDG